MSDVHRQFVVYPDGNVIFHAPDTESNVFPDHVSKVRPDNVKPRTGNALEYLSSHQCTREAYRCHLFDTLLAPALYLVPNLIRLAFSLTVDHLTLDLKVQRSWQDRLSPGRSVDPYHRHLSGLQDFERVSRKPLVGVNPQQLICAPL